MAVQFTQPHRFSADQYRRMTQIGVVPGDRTELIDGVVVSGTRPFQFSSDDYFKLGREGILGEDDRVELIDGEIADMTPIGGRHSRCVSRLNDLLHPRVIGRAELRIQDVLRVRDGFNPQPDVVICRFRAVVDEDDDSQPTAADALLIVEVADTSLLYDRTLKMEEYARGGVPEYWVVDLRRDVVIVARNPVTGQYMEVNEHAPGEAFRSAVLGDAAIVVEDIVGRRRPS